MSLAWKPTASKRAETLASSLVETLLCRVDKEVMLLVLLLTDAEMLSTKAPVLPPPAATTLDKLVSELLREETWPV